MDKNISKAVREFFKESMPAEVEKMARLAGWDLYSGPMTYCEECGVDDLSDCSCEIKYPGFQEAVGIVAEWVDDNVHTLYVEEDSGCVMTREPEGEWLNEECEECDEEDGGVYHEPMPYYQLERADIVKILFDPELASYLR